MFFDYFLVAFRNLRARKTRTWLTMIGIFIGIAAIVSLVSLGQGLKVAINEEFEQMGVDKIMIMPGAGGFFGAPPGSTSSILNKDDLESIRGVKGVKEAGGMVWGITGVRFKDSLKYGYFFGYPTDASKIVVQSMQSVEVIEGRELRKNDKYKAIIGREFYSGRYFGEEVGVGDSLEMFNKSFRVVGMFAPIGNPDDDSTVWIPLDAAAELTGKTDTYDMIFVQVLEGEDVDEVAERIEKLLRRKRDLKRGQEDFSVSTTQELLETFGTILNAVSIVFIGIAAISLVVGGIGIMNTMYTQVMERTTEIGIMKAIGAKNRDVLLIFLIESGMLGMAGGAIGIVLGVILSVGVEKIMTVTVGVEYLKAYFPWTLVVGALAFSFLVGSISGVLPAYGASKLKPAEALRWE